MAKIAVQQLLFGEQALPLSLMIVKHRRFEINFFIKILNVKKKLFCKQTEKTFFNI